MKRTLFVITASLLLTACAYLLHGPTYPEVPRITPEDLRLLLHDPGTTLIDVRDRKDWQASGTKIAGARREDPDAVVSWIDAYPRTGRYVLY